MKKIAITGGIGTGKTFISKMFNSLGVPIYNADNRAKYLMNSSLKIKKNIVKIFGENSFDNNTLNTNYLANNVFQDKKQLSILNSIVHPYVESDYIKWLKKQDYIYSLYESAIIFENKNEKNFNKIICVTSDKNIRIDRLLKIKKYDLKRIKSIFNNQLSDSIKIKKSNYIITNNSDSNLKEIVIKIHQKILNNN